MGSVAPPSLNADFGLPVVVTVNVPAVPKVNVVALALVIAGATPLTVRVKLWVALGETPLLAVMVKGKGPKAVGVPLKVAVPSWLSTKVTPVGSVAPPSLNADFGLPVVVTVNVPALPKVNAATLALVMTGAAPLMVRVKL